MGALVWRRRRVLWAVLGCVLLPPALVRWQLWVVLLSADEIASQTAVLIDAVNRAHPDGSGGLLGGDPRIPQAIARLRPVRVHVCGDELSARVGDSALFVFSQPPGPAKAPATWRINDRVFWGGSVFYFGLWRCSPGPDF
jgi:hypothetical protein